MENCDYDYNKDKHYANAFYEGFALMIEKYIAEKENRRNYNLDYSQEKS